MRTNAYVMVAGLVAGIPMVSGCSAGDDVGTTTSAPTDRTGDDTVTDGGTTDDPQRCVRDSDCPDPLVCNRMGAGRGICGPECREDFDCCPTGTATCGKFCREEQCVPGEPERCDGVDNDADGETDEDFDLASDAANCGRCGLRCDAVLDHTRPGGTTCEDRVCRLRTDGCADGFSDINGTDADGCEYRCHPSNGGIEEPDGDDNNCDGATDEGFACVRGTSRPCGAGTGICSEGTQACRADGTWSDCTDNVGPRTEICNTLDDDCDGVADNGLSLGAEVCDVELVDEDCDGLRNEECDCIDGATQTCGSMPALAGVGICRYGTQTCAGGAWGECEGAQASLTLELCDGIDDNCDGVIPADEVDADRDGYAACANDCDDADRDVKPEANESCNDTDDDCDGDTDEDFSVGVACRGIGACGMGTYECASPTTSRCSTDIGGSAYPTPAPLETCDSVDNDCDGIVDLDADASVVDDDPLNCGACGVECAVPNTTTACVAGACTVTGCAAGFLLVDGACLRCDVWPITAESCDAGFLDDDCDGRRNEDCGCVNGTRQPCGLDPALHGVGVCREGTQTCAGGAWGTCSGAFTPSSEVCDDRDDDCDGVVPAVEVDADGDGFATCEDDCDDTDGAIRPGVAEVCDGDDNDCDGTVDEGFFIGVPCMGWGTCAEGRIECAALDATRCSSDLDGSEAPAVTPTETCDNLVDDDCDGSVDEGCAGCAPGTERPCGVDPVLRGVGICRSGVQKCEPDRTWGVCEDAVTPWSFDTCDKDDNDCDGETDEGYDLTSNPFHCGSCGRSCYAGGNIASASCVPLAGPCFPGETCAEPTPTCVINKCTFGFYDSDGDVTTGCERGCFLTHNGVEHCDGIDNNCDGATDEPPTCAPPPPNASMTFSVTLPAGFPNDATTMFCATFVIGLWSCGGYPVTETTDPGTGAVTYTTSGAAIAGNHEFGLCTARCDMPTGTWVVTEDASGLLVEAATPAVTYDGTARSTNLGRNGRRGGNWVASF